MASASSYDRAQAVIRSMDRGFDRSAVLRWADIRNQATGAERQRIAQLAETLYPLAESPVDQRWLSMFLSGNPQAVAEAKANVKGIGDAETRVQRLEVASALASRAN